MIGFIYTGRPSKEEDLFLKVAKKKNIELRLFNLSGGMNEKELEEKIKECDILYNDSAEDFIIEILKTVEVLGKKVIDPSHLYYYNEDKWLFYVKCKEKNIPTLETILLPNNLNLIRTELKKFGRWPVVIKKIYGTMGEFVEKADNLHEAMIIIKEFWGSDRNRVPLIAQEFLKSFSYRVTLIDKKIVQTAIKENKDWKCTGVYGKKLKKFKVDEELKKILKKVNKVTGISICGLDLLKKGDRWVVLEANAEPGLDFIDKEYELLVGKVLDFLKKSYYKHRPILNKIS